MSEKWYSAGCVDPVEIVSPREPLSKEVAIATAAMLAAGEARSVGRWPGRVESVRWDGDEKGMRVTVILECV